MNTKKELIEAIEKALAKKYGRDGELSGTQGHYDRNGRWVSPESIFFDVADTIEDFFSK